MMQNGVGCTFRNGKYRAMATKAFSPPESSEMVFSALPGGWALISMPQSRMFSGSLQLQLGLTAAEQLHKGLLEALAEKLELLGKNFGHLLRDLPDDAGQLALGFLHVVPLIRQICIPSVDPLELVDGPHIDGAETVDLPFQLRHPAGRLGTLSSSIRWV